ncbi:MAG: acyl-CoA dehydrogenase family protein [Aquabacterium sp.]|jgi:acyl-CoA dehydrogenase|uniref:acyl-CoA dehydrogenase family protein n=1 Tax=Aquabacterium sp. TaxID=1872578 RepID=UPI001B55E727|nr:acyl-CoA dehydrogenase family protein [Aquabacterium sp.]MBP7132018.1 acyl-CoA dehydrogenase family protein [Aquabacterium sp.]MBP9062153.1 acyl-CoA dehydrogenase family protein [Aquabacterium sp.]
MDFQPSERAARTAQRVRAFIDTHIAPVEAEHWAGILQQRHGGDWTAWQIPPRVEALKAKAREEGLWNLFLPDAELGAGLSVLDYAFSAEQTGRSMMAPEIFNCNAPDSGNMEVLWKYGNAEQKAQWLTPLLAGDIRSVFFMTEPDVASSDATNMAATAVIDGDHIVLNGKKWWSSGVGDPRCKIGIFMALTPDESKDRHHQHSMVLVPLDTPGVEIVRMLPVFGEYDEPHGHGEVHFHNVRVPIGHFISGPGRGFEIAQGRLGPGRIHHCMRCIGAAEKALELAIQRGLARTAFRKPLIDLGGNRERIAECRVAIDQARLLTLQAAWKIDTLGVMSALTDVSAIKVVAPTMLQNVVDFAIQMHGGAGVSHDTPLTAFFNQARSLRLADGPDEVHKGMIARLELMKYGVKR